MKLKSQENTHHPLLQRIRDKLPGFNMLHPLRDHPFNTREGEGMKQRPDMQLKIQLSKLFPSGKGWVKRRSK